MEKIKNLNNGIDILLEQTQRILAMVSSAETSGLVESITNEHIKMLSIVISMKRDLNSVTPAVQKENVYLETIEKLRGLVVAQKESILRLKQKPVTISIGICTEESTSANSELDTVNNKIHELELDHTVLRNKASGLERENEKLKSIIKQSMHLLDAKQQQVELLEARAMRRSKPRSLELLEVFSEQPQQYHHAATQCEEEEDEEVREKEKEVMGTGYRYQFEESYAEVLEEADDEEAPTQTELVADEPSTASLVPEETSVTKEFPEAAEDVPDSGATVKELPMDEVLRLSVETASTVELLDEASLSGETFLSSVSNRLLNESEDSFALIQKYY